MSLIIVMKSHSIPPSLQQAPLKRIQRVPQQPVGRLATIFHCQIVTLSRTESDCYVAQTDITRVIRWPGLLGISGY